MAATGQTGMGFPKEYGGGGDIGASIAAFETLAFGDLSVLVKVGRAVRALRRRDPAARHRSAHHDAYLADLITGKADGLLRDDRDRARVQRAGARHGGDVRRGRPQEFVITTTRDGRAQGLHRQRRRSTPSSRWCSPSSTSAATREGVHAFVVPIRDGRRGRAPASGSRTTAARWASTASTTAGSGSTACGSPRDRAAQPVRRRQRGRHLRQRDREPEPPVLHDARHARPGPGLRGRRRRSTPRRWR